MEMPFIKRQLVIMMILGLVIDVIASRAKLGVAISSGPIEIAEPALRLGEGSPRNDTYFSISGGV